MIIKLKVGGRFLYHFTSEHNKSIKEGIVVEITPSNCYIKIKDPTTATTGKESWHSIYEIAVLEILGIE